MADRMLLLRLSIIPNFTNVICTQYKLGMGHFNPLVLGCRNSNLAQIETKMLTFNFFVFACFTDTATAWGLTEDHEEGREKRGGIP